MSARKEFIKNAHDNAVMAKAYAKYYHDLHEWAVEHYEEMSDEQFEALTNSSTPPPPPPKIPPE